jgi:peptidoglycan/xylan/chitin deacetylase (PgdA/CDA1 family)
MALVGGDRRRVQITIAALPLLVAAAITGIGQDEAAGASLPEPQPSLGVQSGQAPVTFSSDVVRGLQDLRTPDPAKPEAKAPQRPSKVVYLTFDDGPSPSFTKPVLDVLDYYGAEATFFQLGENAVAHPGLSRSVVARGHAVGSHTWNHRDLRRLSPRRLRNQIIRTSRALRRITGQPITCLRPPYGAVNGRVRSSVRGKELALKMWDVDPRDWKRPGESAIARRVVSRTGPGDVILLHDGGGNRSQSVRALRRILRTLSAKGYTFESLPGC